MCHKGIKWDTRDLVFQKGVSVALQLFLFSEAKYHGVLLNDTSDSVHLPTAVTGHVMDWL